MEHREADAMKGDLEGFTARAREIAKALRSMHSVTVITHIDADGITAGAIAGQALQRAHIPHEVLFFKKLDDAAIARIDSLTSEGVWLTDLGSGYLSKIGHPGLVVADHHSPDCCSNVGSKKKRDLFDFHDNSRLHLNPHLFGFDGSREASGAGTAYWIARQMSSDNIMLAPLAIVGAVGDLQDNAQLKLVGINSLIRDEAEDAGLLRTEYDLRLFGRETRPLTKFFQYASDPALPGLSNDWYACRQFLDRTGVRLKDHSGRERSWAGLSVDEKEEIKVALDLCMDRQGQKGVLRRIYGEVYVLPGQKQGTELHESKEMSTLLNSCGRYGNERLGLEVCVDVVEPSSREGERDERRQRNIEEALEQLRNHRSNLIGAMNFFFAHERGKICDRRKSIQVLRANGGYLLPEKVKGINAEGAEEEREVFRDTTIGIVAGMVLGSGNVPDDVPILALMRSEGDVKASARGNQRMVDRGLDLSRAMREAAEGVGGTGGGHNVAAGATIPEPRVHDFIDALDDIVSHQMRPST
ncbi:MAG: DHH family phosphoesterase [Methanomassiliicoccales archaeon]|nr:DHH family phosphoesterase [Methanomassiliicoccales archaeon]MDD1756691.1 DHH family phosphoesterase [Methanomassiliicoccales archaeon]